uniref:Low-density lipoprotein receptor-related protein 2-like n=1 Tax=Phallusia mammillata TaxID=59560 RepID=A0A6F9DKQ7_9ASCI|nr:low-density lipoprotein receptor-related protein 2-like [Phallusia mammillata]
MPIMDMFYFVCRKIIQTKIDYIYFIHILLQVPFLQKLVLLSLQGDLYHLSKLLQSLYNTVPSVQCVSLFNVILGYKCVFSHYWQFYLRLQNTGFYLCSFLHFGALTHVTFLDCEKCCFFALLILTANVIWKQLFYTCDLCCLVLIVSLQTLIYIPKLTKSSNFTILRPLTFTKVFKYKRYKYFWEALIGLWANKIDLLVKIR